MQNVIRKLSLATLLVIPVVTGAGCEAADKLKETQGDLCCTDFKVGADMTAVDWKIEGDGKVEFGAFMQATADFSAAASGVLLDLTNACQTLAIDLGASEKDVQETNPGQRAVLWCAAAAAKLQAAGSIEVSIQPPRCSVSASAQASCEAKCSAKAECELQPGEIEARCEGGVSVKCEGSCEGTCQGSADVAVTCEGSCEGTCEGSCEGTCEGTLSGTCEGTCEGTCNGKSTANGGSAQCDGTCEGKCSVAFKNPICKGSCKGSCAGKCRGSCTAEAGAKLQCEGECSGSCSVEGKAPKCNGTLKPPRAECQGSAECSGSCKASAEAKAECTPGTIEIKAAGNLTAQGVASVKANLPKILAVFKARGELLVKTGTAVGELGVKVTAKAPNFSAKAALCVVPAVAAAADALSNAKSSFEASGKVAGAIKLN